MSEKPLPARFAYDNVEFRNDTVFRHYFVNFGPLKINIALLWMPNGILLLWWEVKLTWQTRLN
jgi:hypothetical protein